MAIYPKATSGPELLPFALLKGVIIAGNRRFCQIGRSCVILLHPYGPHTDQVSGKMESPNDGWVARC